ncbi:MAG: hypothetical protein V1867_05185 [Candidatus Falkowbacteria bacterium]
MTENIKDLIKMFNALPAEEQKRLAKEKREITKQNFQIENLNNHEISLMNEFADFCAEKNVTPSKRQAGKLREEYFKWYNERYDKLPEQ